MNKKGIGVSDDLLSFWKVCRNELSALAKLERVYLSPPEVQVIVRGECIQKDRLRLLPKNMETLLLRKYNLLAFYHSTMLPQKYDDFISPNDRFYDNLDSDME